VFRANLASLDYQAKVGGTDARVNQDSIIIGPAPPRRSFSDNIHVETRKNSSIFKWSFQSTICETMSHFLSLITLISVSGHQISECSGTLVTATTCKKGMLIVADRLTKDSIRGKINGPSKILAIGQCTAVASTGRPVFSQIINATPASLELSPLFDANESAASYLRMQDLDDSIYVYAEELSKHLENEFIKAFQNRPAFKWPISDPKDPCLFQTCVFHFARKTKHFEIMLIKLNYKQQLIPIVRATAMLALPNDLETGTVRAFGNTEVIDNALGSLCSNNKSAMKIGKFSNLPRKTLSLHEILKEQEKIFLISESLTLHKEHPTGKQVDAILLLDTAKLKWLLQGKVLK